MSKENKLIPELRFPEFMVEGEWKIKSLDKVVNDFIVPMRDKPKKLDGKIPWCRIEDFDGMYLSSSKSNQGVSAETVQEMNLKVYPVNTLLVSCSADLGRCAITQKELVTNQTFIGLVPNTDKVDIIYLYFLMTNSRNELNARSSGTTISYLSRQEFERFKIGLPKPHEQQKIASCLSSLDELIAAHNEKLEALKEHKKGLMQNLFPQEGKKVPKLRFPEFEKDGEWVHTTVDDNCLLKGRIGYRGYTKQDLVKEGKGALVLGGKHIQNQLLDLSDPTFLRWEKYYESPEIMVEVNHIIFSQRGSLGDCAIIDRQIGKATINPSMVLIKDISCNPRFLYYVLIGDNIQSEVSKNKSSGAIPMLSQKQIKEFPFLIPKPEEQQKIALCLSAMDELIKAQSEKIEQLQQHKKGLMQGLFPKIDN